MGYRFHSCLEYISQVRELKLQTLAGKAASILAVTVGLCAVSYFARLSRGVVSPRLLLTLEFLKKAVCIG